MLGRRIAEQDRLALAAQQRTRDGIRLNGVLTGERRGSSLARADRVGHVGQRLHPAARRGGDLSRHRHQPVVVRGVDAVHLRAFARGLADALCEQRVILTQKRTDDQHALQARQRGDRGAEPAGWRRADGTAVVDGTAGVGGTTFAGGEVRMPGAKVDVLAAQAAHQLGQQVQLLDRAVRRTQRADAARTVINRDLRQAARHVVERGRPVDRRPHAAVLDHRCGEPFACVQRLVREAVAVGDPAFVDFFVLERQDAHDLVVLDLDDQVRTRAVVRADALAP